MHCIGDEVDGCGTETNHGVTCNSCRRDRSPYISGEVIASGGSYGCAHRRAEAFSGTTTDF